MPVLAHARRYPLEQRARNRKAHALAPARRRKNEGVQSDDLARRIYQRSAAVARVDRRIGLYIQEWAVDIGLPRNRTHHSHAHRILQTLRAPEGKHHLSLPQLVVIGKLKR